MLMLVITDTRRRIRKYTCMRASGESELENFRFPYPVPTIFRQYLNNFLVDILPKSLPSRAQLLPKLGAQCPSPFRPRQIIYCTTRS